MYILIAGAGEVGQSLARRLTASKHTVVCVETSREICESLYARDGIVCHSGSGTDIDILQNAGIDKADVAVGTMSADADNLALTILAKQFEVPRVIVRMRNPSYEAAYMLAGASRLVNLVDVALGQLVLEIEEPDVRAVATFGGGKASIVILRIPQDWAKGTATVAEIASSPDFPRDCVITGIFCGEKDEFVIPRGDSDVHAGDKLFLAGEIKHLRSAASYFQVGAPKDLGSGMAK